MVYTIALAPDLGITSNEFVAAWNADKEHGKTTTASVEESASKSFDPSLINAAVQIIGDIGIGVAAGAIIELIKNMSKEKPAETLHHRQLKYFQIENPDGSVLIAVSYEEE